MKPVNVFDAYRGGSHGFSVSLREVVSGGLFTGTRRVPIREFGHVRGANAQIAELTGAEFGEGYERLVADGPLVMDSVAAAHGMTALRQAAPDRAAAPATDLRQAFYADGRSRSDPATYRMVAEASGLDPDTVVATFASPEARAAAEADFRRTAELGVTA